MARQPISDWNQVVREGLSLVDLSDAEQKEIIAELASHLDDLYEHYRTQGLSESQAVTRTRNEIRNWAGLARTIQRAKHKEENMNMNDRTSHLWLPGLAGLVAAAVLLVLEIRLGIHDSFLHLPLAMTAIFPWLANLLLCGGVAAYVSRRGGGSRLARLTSALFPAGAFFVCFCLVLVARLFERDPFISWSAFAIAACNWVLVPGVALLLGALPFLGARPISGPEGC
jgi:hypothetical protein